MRDTRAQFRLWVLLWAAGVACAAPAGVSSPIRSPVEAVGRRLVEAQRGVRWSWGGFWPGEETHTGSIVAGLIDAYVLVGDEDFKTAAQEGADHIRHLSGGNFYGDEAYALACMARTHSADPGARCRVALESFYARVQCRPGGGTRGYLALLCEQSMPSEAVFYVADFTVAAFSIDANDKGIWREGLLRCLARIDDTTAEFPVRSLGMAVWALACTGPLDDAAVDPAGEGQSCWRGKTLAELPELLLGHWIAEGDMAGSFYKRFDHGNGGVGPVAGYTEDTVFGALGLAAARSVLATHDMNAVLGRVREVLLACIDGATGEVYGHLWLTDDECCLYAGEVLQALAAVTNPADLDLDGRVDGVDLAVLAGHWRCEGGAEPCPGNRADINRDGRVDESDLMELARRWLQP